MEIEIDRCSTPLIEQNTVPPNFPWSQIRGERETFREDVVGLPEIKKKKTKQRRGKDIQKNSRPKTNNAAEYNFDSDYEFVTEHEICNSQQSVDDLDFSEKHRQPSVSKFTETRSSNLRNNGHDSSDFQSNNSSPPLVPLFYSPSENEYDNYAKLYFDFPEDQTPSISSHCDIVSPEFQLAFRDPTKFKTYSARGIKKKRLSPSQISFSPKWPNRVAAKYNSPSDIPSRNTTIFMAGDTSFVKTDSTSQLFSYGAESLWEDFTKNMSPSTKRSPLNKKSRDIEERDVEYSHLRVNEDKFKRFNSPTQKQAVFGKENEFKVRAGTKKKANALAKPLKTRYFKTIAAQDENSFETAVQLGRNNHSDDKQSSNASKLSTRKRNTAFPKYDTISPVKVLGVSSKKNSSSPFLAEVDAGASNNTVNKKLKPSVISVEIIKDSRLAKA